MVVDPAPRLARRRRPSEAFENWSRINEQFV
jgi:hypothetical protein